MASAGFLLLVPGAIWLSYVGHDYGLYSQLAIPIIFGVVVALGIALLFATLPTLRRWEQGRNREGD